MLNASDSSCTTISSVGLTWDVFVFALIVLLGEEASKRPMFWSVELFGTSEAELVPWVSCFLWLKALEKAEASTFDESDESFCIVLMFPWLLILEKL